MVYTIKTVQQATAPLRKAPFFFVVFGASAIVAFMFVHLFEIGTRAVQRVIEGNFVYDYRFYSLMLMGTVFIAIGIKHGVWVMIIKESVIFWKQFLCSFC